MDKILEVDNLSVCFGDSCVVDDVSFYVEKGDYMMILGPNGAGKSVMFKSILGILPKKGKVKFFVDKDIEAVRQKVSYVPQYVAIDRTSVITVAEVVGLGLQKYDLDTVLKLLKMVGMENKKDAVFGSLSGGQTKRVLIAQALAKKPKIIFMDEPFAGVDVVGEKSVAELLDELRKKMNLTVIMISHDFSLVQKSATKILCINKKKMCFGHPKDMTKKNIEDTFGKGLKVHSH